MTTALRDQSLPGTAATSPPASPATARLLSLDVFRGATIMAMILVNNPGAWGEKYQYWPLDHAEWHGWTPTDLIFPFFLFIVGTAMAYSLRKYRHGTELSPAVYWRIIRRTAVLIFLGWMPSLLLKTIHAFHGETFDLSNLRIFGVLVRIAIVYFFASLIVLHFPIARSSRIGIRHPYGLLDAPGVASKSRRLFGKLSHKGNIVGLFDRSHDRPDAHVHL